MAAEQRAPNTMKSALPIRRLTLYKHGIGVVEREGALAADELTMTLRAGEVDDVLKSLLVHDRGGGQVLGIHYETPRDRQARLDDAPFDLSPDHSLLDLLRALRGQQVRLTVGEGAKSDDVSGRLLGIDVPSEETPGPGIAVSVLDEGAGAVTTTPLERVRRVTLLDERGAQDLRYVLDSSRDDERQRALTIRLSPGQHDLSVSYLVPSPTWRVGYRLVAELASDGASEAGETPGGELALQGWGLFDNALEEDLENVEVTLVAGQPISFVYDLAAARVPERPVVQDAARVAAAPVEFEGTLPEAAAAAYDARPLAAMSAQMVDAPAAMRSSRARRPSVEEMARQEPGATGGDLGELFQYRITAPVTVRRGASAMAPILTARLPYRRELLFNERKLHGHPVAALRFDNRAGVVLERGPVTVYEDGEYRGEAILPFAKEGDEVYLAFAVELGLRVTLTSEPRVETAGIGIADALLHLKQAITTRTTYRLASSLGTDSVVTVEHPSTPHSELAATRPPDARTAEAYRWNVACPARQVTLFTVEERRYTWQSQRLLDYSYAALQQYLTEQWLDRETLARLAPLLDARSTVERNERAIAALTAERDELYGRQEHLRKNMAALGEAGAEGALRARAVGQLEAGEDRLDAIAAEIATRQAENARLQALIAGTLATLRAGEAPADHTAP